MGDGSEGGGRGGGGSGSGSAAVKRSGRRIFVTGASGVIGRRVVPALVRQGHEVTAAGHNPSKLAALASAGATTVVLDLFDRDAVRRAVDGHDIVINLATHMPSSTFRMMLPWMWKENDRVRREGSAILVDAALAGGVSKFLQESFAPVYADAGAAWIDERAPQRPTSYNVTVLDAEASAARFDEARGGGIVLRFAGFYGPDRLLADMASMVKHGWTPLPGPADAYVSSVAHDDAAAGVVAAVDAPAGTYNICDDEPLTRREWADALAAALGVKPPRLMPRWMTALGGSIVQLLSRSERMSNAKFKGATGWSPRWSSAREGLREAVRALPA